MPVSPLRGSHPPTRSDSLHQPRLQSPNQPLSTEAGEVHTFDGGWLRDAIGLPAYDATVEARFGPEVPISGSVATTSGSRLDEPSEYSVGELLRNRMGGDRWHLALVQRDEVWDVERMRRLLDSLLAGYPVGALLLCRTDKVASKVIDRDGDEKTVREAPEGAYQLLDGQQRLNALYTMLTASDEKHRKYGRFYLDLTMERSRRARPVRGAGGRRCRTSCGERGRTVRSARSTTRSNSWALPEPVAALPLGRGRGRGGSW